MTEICVLRIKQRELESSNPGYFLTEINWTDWTQPPTNLASERCVGRGFPKVFNGKISTFYEACLQL